MIYQDNLKIEFRAVPYSSMSDSHVLQFRISPEQDLTYNKEYLFFGFKINIKKKFKTNWHDATRCLNYPSAYLYEESEVWGHPIFVYSKTQLDVYKYKYKTIGEFFKQLDKENSKELQEYKIKRDNYLTNKTIWT